MDQHPAINDWVADCCRIYLFSFYFFIHFLLYLPFLLFWSLHSPFVAWRWCLSFLSSFSGSLSSFLSSNSFFLFYSVPISVLSMYWIAATLNFLKWTSPLSLSLSLSGSRFWFPQKFSIRFIEEIGTSFPLHHPEGCAWFQRPRHRPAVH